MSPHEIYGPERDDELAHEAEYDDMLSLEEEPILAQEQPDEPIDPFEA